MTETKPTSPVTSTRMMRAHVDEGGQLSHRNGLDLLAEVERLNAAKEGLVVSEMTGRSLTPDMQLHLLNDSLFSGGDFGPLSTLTGDIYRMLEAARAAGEKRSGEILCYIHERICRARHEIAGDETRELAPMPTFPKAKA